MSSSAFPDAAAHWNQRFQRDDYLFGTEPNAWLREYEADVHEGSGHHGRSALIGLVARR